VTYATDGVTLSAVTDLPPRRVDLALAIDAPLGVRARLVAVILARLADGDGIVSATPYAIASRCPDLSVWRVRGAISTLFDWGLIEPIGRHSWRLLFDQVPAHFDQGETAW
jgi:hypothetical protein